MILNLSKEIAQWQASITWGCFSKKWSHFLSKAGSSWNSVIITIQSQYWFKPVKRPAARGWLPSPPAKFSDHLPSQGQTEKKSFLNLKSCHCLFSIEPVGQVFPHRAIDTTRAFQCNIYVPTSLDILVFTIVTTHLVCEAVKISELVRIGQNRTHNLWQPNLAMIYKHLPKTSRRKTYELWNWTFCNSATLPFYWHFQNFPHLQTATGVRF